MSGIGPVTLQVMLGALRAACEEMGAVLVRSAHSANIKERRDASTALFDAGGEMVMQAEHIPVHLGAMPAAVAAVLGEEHSPGRAWILNDPYRGGTHLPDVTVISPLFHAGELIGFAASRAHHADVGAREPGSMPADSRTLADEGVVIPPTPLTDEVLRELAGRNAQPAPARGGPARPAGRGPRRRGAGGGAGRALRPRRPCAPGCARRSTTPSAAPVPGSPSSRTGHATARDVLEAPEGDLELRLRATVSGDELALDFGGSAAQHEGNLNCPLAVTVSACYFALRVLTDPDVPACAGAYRPLTVVAPAGSLLNARAAGRGGGGQRGDLVARGRPRAGRVRAGLRAGHDEQPDAGQRRLHLLRDARRRPGGLPGRRRPERRARGDVEHAEHADRGARAGVPAAGRASTRCGGARAAPGATAAATAWSASWRRSRRCATR